MKIRQGFVSNSSVTSFCIYGTCFNYKPFTLETIKKIKKNKPEEFKNYLKLLKDNNKSWLVDDIKKLENIDNITKLEGDGGFDELFVENLPNNLEWHSYNDAGCYYIGRSWSAIHDDETGKQFKDSIEKALNSLFDDNIKFATYAEAWRDG